MGAVMFGAFAISSAMFIPVAPSPMYGLQFSFLLFVASVPMSMSLANYLNSEQRIHFVLRLIMLAAGLYALLGFATLSTLRSGSRFSGVSSSAPLFVITGGLLLPVALWSAFNDRSKRWRVYGMIVGAMIAMLCLISGQRTGTFAGFIACTPLLVRLGLRRLVVGFFLAIAAVVLLAVVIAQFPEQAEFIQSRFTSIDFTGRESRWSRAIELCLKSPMLGHGPGASSGTGFGFHNAYLMAWYDGGIVGLLFFAGAYCVIAFQAMQLGFFSRQVHSQEIARLVLGQILGLAAAGFFEGKTLSPSNIAMFFALLGSIIVARLRILQHEANYAVRHRAVAMPRVSHDRLTADPGGA
jgi:O-antigen ligase